MLELNKEYTYSQICEALGWDVKAGNSKKAQIKEIEGSYKFYHPMNKKTHKEKKSYIFTEQLKELVEPSLANSRGNNNKNIRPMIEYLQGYLSDDYIGNYYTFGDWFYELLDLLDKDLCKVVYGGDDEITAYCKEKGIQNKKLLCDYVSGAKSILKRILLKALDNMQKNDLCEFDDGYIILYQMGKNYGYVNTDILNEEIIRNETTVCNDLKEEHSLSNKLKGRQLLMQIYNSKELTEAFDEFKVLELMSSATAIEKLNKWIEAEYRYNNCKIDEKHPIVNYYRGVCVHGMEFVDTDTKELANEICSILKAKTEKMIYGKYFKNASDEKIYIYNSFEHSAEMDYIAKLLFKREVLAEPIVEGNDCLPWDDDLDSEIFPWNRGESLSDGKIVLTREEAEELFA